LISDTDQFCAVLSTKVKKMIILRVNAAEVGYGPRLWI
jgi:hypothetical protein